MLKKISLTTIKFLCLFLGLTRAINYAHSKSQNQDSLPTPIFQNQLKYKLDYKALENGNFQYFYSLLKQVDNNFKNLYNENCLSNTSEIVETFLPLDTKKLWNAEDGNYLAVLKLNYILPTNIKNITEEKINNQIYLQQTMPQNKVIKNDDHYFISGTLLTPDFKLYLKFLASQSPVLKTFKSVDIQKIENGTMKVSFQHQDNFGRVMFFQTAKMASAVNIYEEYNQNETIVTAYIIGNIINVPTHQMIRESMIENMQYMVRGSRMATQNF